MKRVLVYSHDTFGLGNIRRMLAICEQLIEDDPTVSILLITGSPVIHELRLPPRLDYIKLPCLTRTAFESYETKYLGADIGEMMRLRSDLILSAVANFKPDLLLVDKKPYGVKNELLHALHYAQLHLPNTKCTLVLRDILDTPERTREIWQKHGYYNAVRNFYDQVFVLGMPEHFDLRRAYQWPDDVSAKVRFCGYLRRRDPLAPRQQTRAALGLKSDEKFVLVTPGGGQDGYVILSTYLESLALWQPRHRVRSILVSGPEMPAEQKAALRHAAAKHPSVKLYEFTRELFNWMNAADLVVAMGGFNTVCELLALKQRALIVPRVRPAQEQLIRADHLAALGLLNFIHPDALTPQTMTAAIWNELHQSNITRSAFARLDMNALPNISDALGLKLTVAASAAIFPADTRQFRHIAARAAASVLL